MTRRIKKRDYFTIVIDLICSDVLGDSTSLTRDDIGLANSVQKGGLTMINMAENTNYRGSGFQERLVILIDDLSLLLRF